MTASYGEEFLKPFLNDEFDEKTFTSTIIQGQDVSLCLKNIQRHIERLDNDLKQHVNVHHQDLLSQAVGIEKLESVLDLMLTRTGTLVNGVAKIQRKVQEPCANLEARVKQLERMQITCEVLRKTLRIVYLTSRLQGQVKDISKSSATINELEYLFNTVSWNGIEVLEKNRRITQHIREDLERQAWSMISMSTHNQSQFGLALQVFHNLNSLPKVLRKLLSEWLKEFENTLNSTVDVESLNNLSSSKNQSKTQGPGRAAIPSAGQASAFRAALWTQIDRLLDQFYQTASKMKLLLKILGKKRDINMSQRTLLNCLLLDLQTVEEEETDKQAPDQLSHEEIIKFLGGSDALNDSRWSPDIDRDSGWNSQSGGYFVVWATQMMKEKFENAVNQSSFFKQAFEGEYPKLVKLSLDLGQRLTDILPSIGSDGPYLNSDTITSGTALPACFWVFLTPLENAYLSRSLSRLMDPVELGFSGSVSSTTTSVPNNEEIESFVKIVCSEITLASVEDTLVKKIARNVSKSIHLLVTQAEQLLVVSGEASQVVAAPTPGQQLNIKLINCLHSYHTSIDKALHQQLRLPANSPVLSTIEQSMQELVKLMEAGLEPLLQSITDSLQAIILTMHQENFSSPSASQSGSQSSLYMQELTEFSSRVKAQYLAPFSCSQLVHQCLLKPNHLPSCLESFLIQASLLRDLSDNGKARLAADCTHLEKALANLLCGHVQDLGNLFKRLRAFKPLLFQSTEMILQSPSVGSDSLPYSMVLHHLFSRSPLDLQSPHVSAGWSITRYTQWSIDHPDEKDRLLFIKGSLDAYAQTVRYKGQKEYMEIYPEMVALLQKGMQTSQRSA